MVVRGGSKMSRRTNLHTRLAFLFFEQQKKREQKREEKMFYEQTIDRWMMMTMNNEEERVISLITAWKNDDDGEKRFTRQVAFFFFYNLWNTMKQRQWARIYIYVYARSITRNDEIRGITRHESFITTNKQSIDISRFSWPPIQKFSFNLNRNWLIRILKSERFSTKLFFEIKQCHLRCR